MIAAKAAYMINRIAVENIPVMVAEPLYEILQLSLKRTS